VVYDLLSDTDISLCSFTHRLRSVEIPVETREIATGDVKPDPMPVPVRPPIKEMRIDLYWEDKIARGSKFPSF